MSDRKRTASKVSLGMLKGKPMSTSVPTFRFHAGEEEIEQVYPEIEEESPDREVASKNDTLLVSQSPPVAPPRSPKHGRPAHNPHTGVASAGEVSPVHTSLSTGSLNKRSSSMDTGIVDAPGHNSGWGLFTDIKGKIVRTVEEMKSDRQKLNSSQKENTSFSDSEEASSSESNQNPSTNLSTSDSVSQLSGVSGMSSLSTTPTTPSTTPLVQKSNQTSGKWHHKFLGDRGNDEEKSKLSRPTTPVKNSEDKNLKSTRAGSVPLVHEDSSVSPQKRCTSLRSRFRPKMAELRNRRKKVSVESRSNSSLSSALYSVDGDETDDDVESGVEALEEPWEDASSHPRPPSAPLGVIVSDKHQESNQSPNTNLKSLFSDHKFAIILLCFVGIQCTVPLPSVFAHVMVGVLLVLSFQEEKQTILGPSASVASMHMGNKPFEIPDYGSLPMPQALTVKELLPTDSFQGWMNELYGVYDTKTYHISMTESVHVRLDGSCLTLSHTRTKVSKRAMWNETPIRNVQFTDERIFDLKGWRVKLLPEGITRRRQWSKKYPICLIKCDECDTLNHDDLSFNGDERSFKKNEKDIGPTRSNVSLTTAKYAKSPKADSLHFLSHSSEVQKETSKSDVKSHKAENCDDNEKVAGDDIKVYKDCSERDASDLEDDSFCVINSDLTAQSCIYLFARADREKEEWYRRLAEAVRENEIHSLQESPVKSNAPTPTFGGELFSLTPEDALATMGEYLRYMQHFNLEHKMYPPRPKHRQSVKDDKRLKEKERDKDKEKEKDKEKDRERDKEHEKDHIDSIIDAEEQKAVINGLPMSWLNAIIGRICFDVLRSPLWRGRILQRLQKKLSTLKLPYFMEALTITELDLGNTVPVFHRASQPSIDVRGLWVELDMTYQGNFRMTIESKLNLMKLKRSSPEDGVLASASSSSIPPQEIYTVPTLADISASRSPVFDSDLDDSAESSSDDDTSSVNTEDGSHRSSTSASSKRAGKKLLRMVDKIAASKYFQQATEMKYIKKAMEGVSNTRIMLSVELRGLVGTLAVNIPPPPSDRIWYGFHGNPKLWLSAQPTLGERQVNFYHISNWIEQKLCQEFQKVLVLPNMDDIVIPVMSPHLPV